MKGVSLYGLSQCYDGFIARSLRGTTCLATEMWTSPTLRHHTKPPVNPANMNVLALVMETKQVCETAAQQTDLPIEFIS